MPPKVQRRLWLLWSLFLFLLVQRPLQAQLLPLLLPGAQRGDLSYAEWQFQRQLHTGWKDAATLLLLGLWVAAINNFRLLHRAFPQRGGHYYDRAQLLTFLLVLFLSLQLIRLLVLPRGFMLG